MIFYCLLDFLCAKYGISLEQKRSFEHLQDKNENWVMFGNHKFYFHYLA